MAVYDVPASNGKKRENRFAFRHSGKVYSIPKTPYLSGKASKFIKDNQEDTSHANLTRGIIEIECPTAADAVWEMDDEQIVNIAEAWFEASGFSAGESEGSSDS
ncbi:hypothetical protein [Nocardia arthritidis]|uniref:Uncharacterized protein n=1 Tax=Nocardia arthritidis TaxID=228602 RepID=A0A6G9YT50_9NOCA|nr:hypothetical protein [Nocardia arthritidis]QIS16499.1 hypothetical protein F5544_43475 [Nocardia arthritidis]